MYSVYKKYISEARWTQLHQEATFENATTIFTFTLATGHKMGH